MPVLCNGESAEILIDSITTGWNFGGNKLRPEEIIVFSEKNEIQLK